MPITYYVTRSVPRPITYRMIMRNNCPLLFYPVREENHIIKRYCFFRRMSMVGFFGENRKRTKLYRRVYRLRI